MAGLLPLYKYSMYIFDTLTPVLMAAKALLVVICFGLEIKMRPKMSVGLFMPIWLCIFESQKRRGNG